VIPIQVEAAPPVVSQPIAPPVAPAQQAIETLPATAPVSAFTLEPAAGHSSSHLEAQSEPQRAPEAVAEPSPRPSARPELVPVPASIFDDEFFRAPASRISDAQPEAGVRPASTFTPSPLAPAPAPVATQEQPLRYDAIPTTQIETPARVPSFAGLGSARADTGETDELDIPAFLRRGH
jgi:cell division protein FtsZ